MLAEADERIGWVVVAMEAVDDFITFVLDSVCAGLVSGGCEVAAIDLVPVVADAVVTSLKIVDVMSLAVATADAVCDETVAVEGAFVFKIVDVMPLAVVTADDDCDEEIVEGAFVFEIVDVTSFAVVTADDVGDEKVVEGPFVFKPVAEAKNK